jgi:predicted nucleotidyltransferase
MAFDPERLAPAIAAGPPARLVVLFGSAAKGPMHAGSDVDIGWIPVDPNLSLGDELAFQAALTGAAGLEVDLVRLDQASTICRYEVARDGLKLAGDRGEFVRFRADSIGDYLDFEPALRAATERYRQAILGGVDRGRGAGGERP